MSDMKKKKKKQTNKQNWKRLIKIKPTVVLHLRLDFFPSFPLMQKRIMLLYFYMRLTWC